MGKTKTPELRFHLWPLIEFYGHDKVLDEVVKHISFEQLVESLRKKRKLADLWAAFTPAERAAFRNRNDR